MIEPGALTLPLRSLSGVPPEPPPGLHVVQRDVADPEPAPPSGQGEWESVYRQTVVYIYRFIYARVGNRPDTEDLTTQVYMRSLPRLRLPASEPEIRAYLIAAARTVLADHWRSRYDAPLTELSEDVPARLTSSSQAREEATLERVERLLAQLPSHYRRLLELRFLQGYSVREVASEMAISVTHAKVMQHRALKRAATLEPED